MSDSVYEFCKHEKLYEAIVNACENNDIESLQLLLTLNINFCDSRYTESPIIYKLIDCQSIDVLRILLKAGFPINLNEYFTSIMSPLYWTIQTENHDLIKLFVISGAIIDSLSFNEAVRRDDLDTIKIFLDQGFDLDRVDNFYLNDILTTVTPLMVAVIGNKIKIAEFLIERGANLYFDDGHGNTPLKYAKSKNFDEMVQMLELHDTLDYECK